MLVPISDIADEARLGSTVGHLHHAAVLFMPWHNSVEGSFCVVFC